MLLTTLQLQGAPESSISNYQQAFGLKKLPAIATHKAHVTVMYEQNFVNARISVSIPIYMPSLNQTEPFSFPAYPKSAAAATPLNVSFTLNDKLAPLTDTQLIVNTNALAAKDLQQQYPIIFVREALRVLTKMSMIQNLQNNQKKQNNNNNLATTLMQMYTAFSDRPDLRSWLTLPADIQIAQYDLTPGTYKFHFSNNSLGTDTTQELKANQYYLIWVTGYGKEMQAKVFPL
jgi:uncharacterized protein